jgi:hypothetical protein
MTAKRFATACSAFQQGSFVPGNSGGFRAQEAGVRWQAGASKEQKDADSGQNPTGESSFQRGRSSLKCGSITRSLSRRAT